MKHFRKISDYAVIGGLSALVAVSLAACGSDAGHSGDKNSANVSNTLQKGAFVILEEQKDGSYKVAEEYPSEKTHVVVRDINGNERVLSQEEIDKLIKQEESRIDNGTSNLTNPNSSGGLGLGGALLASAAGAILGSYIGNKLFNNPAYKQNQQRNYKSPQAYERSQNSFKNTSATRASSTPSNAKSGFFGNNSNTSSTRSTGSFGS
ncbi:UPF0323 family lipoprotein [Helicobacter cappadocius]|uniref:UPF0323 family lipoprotein n=1 Tax=Helicobacter cappadocius TaxID=3063998 RepID=A0AA90TBE4_9HELI|nr:MULTISPECIES: UPF0323 family lipoprotein [unclassified Helicobacter]MDO7253158.1 UPF0323 family lipoprotein [Helicobacter sp. faydin-H75]MDP2538716.1 UPF0323 family lipoprotein [Helicobacter sp. faydin-H76]